VAQYEADVAQLVRRMDAGIDEVTAVGDRGSAVLLASLKGKVLFALSRVRQA
jgi:hypothetical protein